MAAVLATLSKWCRNASHAIATPAPIPRLSPPKDQFSRFRGSRGRLVGPSAGAHHLAIVYRPEAVLANDLIRTCHLTRAQDLPSAVTVTSNCYRRDLHT
jgi:hypothetical protein